MKNLLQTRIEMPSFILEVERAVARKVSRFFARPFSIWAAMVLAFLFGALSPLHLRFLDYKRFASWDYDFRSVPWIPVLFTIVVLVVLYWQSHPSRFAWNRRTVTGTILGCFLFVESLAISYFCCAREHLCMGGHLDHPPHSTLTYMCDAAWASGLIVAVIAFSRCRSPLTAVSGTLAGFLISFRFIFGSFGGIYLWF